MDDLRNDACQWIGIRHARIINRKSASGKPRGAGGSVPHPRFLGVGFSKLPRRRHISSGTLRQRSKDLWQPHRHIVLPPVYILLEPLLLTNSMSGVILLLVPRRKSFYGR